MPDWQLNHGHREEVEIRGVGYVASTKDNLNGGLTIPAERLDALLQGLIADRLKYLVMQGEPLRYRHASIHGYSLDSTLKE
jgi:hypothetical protein